MQSRSRFQVLVGALMVLALVSWAGQRTAAAETLDLAAIFTADCAFAGPADAAAGDDLAFLDVEQPAATPAPNTPDDKQPKTCRINGNCWKPAYCAKEMGTCKGQGVCKAKPEVCPDVVDPVCGCNHKTYNNECMANRAGQNVIHKGECEKKGK